MSDDYLARIERVLAQHEIRDYRIERTRRHRRVVIERGGRQIAVTFPTTPSDWRGPLNAAADLRRALGLGGRRAAP
jgi:hypothetical protein